MNKIATGIRKKNLDPGTRTNCTKNAQWNLKAASSCHLTNWRQFFYASVLLLIINCVTPLSKWLWNHEPQASGSEATLTMLWRNLSAIRGQTHKKLTSICFFTITRPEMGQMLVIRRVFQRQVCRVQVAYLNSAARASPSKEIYPLLYSFWA